MKNKQLSLKDKQILTNEWAMILSSGLPISEGLYILQDQVMNKDLKEVIESIQKDFLENGDFAGAIKRLEKQKKIKLVGSPNSKFQDIYLS